MSKTIDEIGVIKSGVLKFGTEIDTILLATITLMGLIACALLNTTKYGL